ncbi:MULTISPECIES: NADP-dependent oxidoreductase [unclassified Streptomyces]|uniref:NADP-dependent oxidoreductase n=1 Tax=unclassified Streptomyces TaxID=2593676 RepID=UPI002366A217|nr:MULTISPECIES: NADP-dependent oxidoreductase [unclassified Streptomyces]MDF3140557.1 NADP-dependent oxidoreductase [Streptomyces sp. T21Q-yed]WDF44375.1 NADP-dependent oxidoreductase [Streptomyces sp. T12]
MRAFTVERYGDKAGVRAGEVPDPEVGADDVLVRIHAASVNPLDRMIRDGELKAILPYRPPVVLGNDLAGIVVEVGAAVTRFAVGDEVFARPDKDRIGTFAELIAVHQDDVAIKPATLTMEEAASLPLVALTSWQALVERANIQPGQRVLVHAGSGGLRTIAIQLAKHLGAHVATTTSTANVDLVKRLGADVVVDYKKQAFETVLHDYDVVLDSLGGETLLKSLDVLKPGGQVISVSGPPDAAFGRELEVNPVIRLVMSALSSRIRRRARRRNVTYSFLFMKASGDQLRELTPLIEAGRIRPVVDTVFSLESAPEALEYLETGRAKAGKVVLKMA